MSAQRPQFVSAPDRVLAESARLVDEYSVGPVAKAEVVEQPARPSSVSGPAATQVMSGQRAPNVEIKEEKSQHHIMVYLKSQGYTNREIARATGYTESWISQVSRQPWFKTRVVEVIKEQGGDAVKTFLAAEALPSLEVLAEIRDDEKAPTAARVAATNSILDRAFGKPTQHIESQTTVNVKNAQASASAIEKELEAINEQLRARGQPVTNV